VQDRGNEANTVNTKRDVMIMDVDARESVIEEGAILLEEPQVEGVCVCVYLYVCVCVCVCVCVFVLLCFTKLQNLINTVKY